MAFFSFLMGPGPPVNNAGIFTNVGGTIAAVARTGDTSLGPNLGTGVNFSYFNDLVLNNNGRVAFRGTLTSGSFNS